MIDRSSAQQTGTSLELWSRVCRVMLVRVRTEMVKKPIWLRMLCEDWHKNTKQMVYQCLECDWSSLLVRSCLMQPSSWSFFLQLVFFWSIRMECRRIWINSVRNSFFHPMPKRWISRNRCTLQENIMASISKQISYSSQAWSLIWKSFVGAVALKFNE